MDQEEHGDEKGRVKKQKHKDEVQFLFIACCL
jgi:hypothetical protein